MKRRFVIGVSGLSIVQEQLLREYLRTLGAWWHWTDGLWLFTTEDAEITAGAIRTKIREIGPASGLRVVVLEVKESITWATFGPTSKGPEGKSIASWIKSTWDTD